MNFFPYMFDFKNPNLYNMSYSHPYAYQYPFLNQNQLTLTQYQYAPSLWSSNNGLFQNYKDQTQTQLSNEISSKLLPSSKQSDTHISQQLKNFQDKEKKEKKVFKQKEGRNMISNLFRQALKSMLNEKDRTIEIIQKISIKHQIQINPKEFLEGISKKLKNLKNYVRIGQIQTFLKGKDTQKSKDHAKILRILVYQFLRQEVIPCLCNNPKVQSNNRRSHIFYIRKFQELLVI